MYTTKEMQDRILQLKKENDVCILAHAYQSHDIWEVADYVGDSYGLSVQASKSDCKNVLMCGVRFMAETVKILSPEKRVLLSNSEADCPMANQMDADMILQGVAGVVHHRLVVKGDALLFIFAVIHANGVADDLALPSGDGVVASVHAHASSPSNKTLLSCRSISRISGTYSP